MIQTLLLLAAQTTVLYAQEQPQMAVALLTSGEGSTISLSKLLDAVAPSVDSAGLSIRSMEQVGVDPDRIGSCPATTRLSCWARVVRRASGGANPRYLLVVSTRANEGRLRMSAIVVDLADAERIEQSVSQSARVENELFGAALRVDERVVDREERAVRAWFESVTTTPLRAFLEARGHWRSLGSLDVVGLEPGTEVLLDDEPVGTTRSTTAKVEHVASGRRRVALRTSTSSSTQIVDVRPMQTTRVVVVHETSTSYGPQWLTLGVSAVAVVAGLVAVGIASSNAGSVRAGCLMTSGGDPDCGRRPVSTGFDGQNVPTMDADLVDAGGVPLAPLGAGLLGLGVGAGVMTALTWDRFETWLAATVGVGLGVAAFVVSGFAAGAF